MRKTGSKGEVMPTVQNEIVRDGFARGNEVWAVRVCIRSSDRMILFQGKVEKQDVVYTHSLIRLDS